MSRCNLPPALLAEWPGSFTCRCSNTGLERTPNQSAQKVNAEEKLLPPLLPGIEMRPSDHESVALPRTLHSTNKILVERRHLGRETDYNLTRWSSWCVAWHLEMKGEGKAEGGGALIMTAHIPCGLWQTFIQLLDMVKGLQLWHKIAYTHTHTHTKTKQKTSPLIHLQWFVSNLQTLK